MYKIEKRRAAFHLTFAGFIQKAEMESWLSESRNQLSGAQAPFGVIVDMRTLSPLPKDAQEVMVKGQKLFRAAGMTRSAVILNNPITTAQFRRIAMESGIYAWERYLDASSDLDWHTTADDWVSRGMDPDRVKVGV